MKTNEDFLIELQIGGYFALPDGFDEFFMKILEEKDKQSKQEKREIIENLDSENIEYTEARSWNDVLYTIIQSNIDWKKEQLNKLK